MKKILKPTHILHNLLALAFLMSFSILTTTAQNSSTGLYATKGNAFHTVSDHASLSVYPDPAADAATLVFNSSNYSVPYQVRIISNEGVQLQNMEGTTVQGRNTINIHVGNYPPGVYYIQLLTLSGRETLRLLKQPLNRF